ncbi:MAG: stage III sporulation protein AF [Oscillospiraceae bacterium]
MEDIRMWATAICYCAIVCSLLFIILPEGSNTKIYKMLGGLVFLTCLISPLMNLRGIELSLDLQGSNTQMEQARQQAEKIASDIAYSKSNENIKSIIKEELAAIGVVPEKIEVNIHNNENDNISCIVAELTLKQTDIKAQQQVKELLSKQLGISCNITYSKEEIKT